MSFPSLLIACCLLLDRFSPPVVGSSTPTASSSSSSYASHLGGRRSQHQLRRKPGDDDPGDLLTSCRRRDPKGCRKISASDDDLAFCFPAGPAYTLTITSRPPGPPLRNWTSLKGYPYCWKYLAPVLCAIYLPKCEPLHNSETSHSPLNVGGDVGSDVGVGDAGVGDVGIGAGLGAGVGSSLSGSYEVLDRQVCLKSRRRCSFVRHLLPRYLLDCRSSLFHRTPPSSSANCTLTRKSMDYVAPLNRSCAPPLRFTEHADSYYDGVPECGMSCYDDRQMAHSSLAYVFLASTTCSAFAVATAALSWRRSRRYPQAMAFYANACLLVAGVACCCQWLPGARRDVVCRRDGTPRFREPRISEGESATCALVFALLYYTGAAGVSWVAALAFAWRVSFAALTGTCVRGSRGGGGGRGGGGAGRTRLARCAGYLHVWCWCAPLVLTIACLANSGVEGYPGVGVCFVSSDYRLLYVLIPAGVTSMAALAMIGDGVRTLLKLGDNHSTLMSPGASRKLRQTVRRVLCFAVAVCLCFAFACSAHAFDVHSEQKRTSALRQLVLCRLAGSLVPANSSYGPQACRRLEAESTASVVPGILGVLGFAGVSALMASFACTRDTRIVWKRFFKRRLRALKDKEGKRSTAAKKSVEKYKIIAEAFKKRGEMHLDGQISLSFATGYDIEDPLGLRMVGNRHQSQASGSSWAGDLDVSESWMAAIPRLVQRRGAICLRRRYSDSDLDSVRSSLRRWSSAASDSLFGAVNPAQRRVSDRSSTSREKVLERLSRIHGSTTNGYNDHRTIKISPYGLDS